MNVHYLYIWIPQICFPSKLFHKSNSNYSSYLLEKQQVIEKIRIINKNLSLNISGTNRASRTTKSDYVMGI